MIRVRNMLADLLVGIAIVLIVWWVLRRVIGMVLWLVNALAFVIVIVVLFALAGRVRGRRPG